MITEMQVVVTCVLVVVVAVVSWCAAAWWTAGRYEEEIRGLEDELELRRPFGRMPDEVAHEVAASSPADALMFSEHARTALAVVREGPAWPLFERPRGDAIAKSPFVRPGAPSRELLSAQPGGYLQPEALFAAFNRSYGGKVHDIHGGPGKDCWCGYVGHDPDMQSLTAWTRAQGEALAAYVDTLIEESKQARDGLEAG